MNGEERIEQLLARYFAAETTPAEERELRAWFLLAEEVPARWRPAQTLFRGLEGLAQERMPHADASRPVRTDTSSLEKVAGTYATRPMDARWQEPDADAAPTIPLSRPVRRRKPLWWGVAAAAVVLVAVLGAELLRKPYCYIDGVAIYDKHTAMQTTAYLDGLSRLDDPMRIVDELIEKSE